MGEPPITVFADYVCPFCYLGRASLSTYRDGQADPPPVEWHPFDLRARRRTAAGHLDPDADDGKDDEYYEQARRNVRRLSESFGVEMTRELATDVDSLPAQIASYHVQEADPERWPAFDEAIFDACWRDARDVGDVEVLTGLAADCGLDPAEIRAAIAAEDTRATVRRKFQAAREAGITGVPTFVYGGRAARGAVPPAHLERLVDG